MKRLPSLYIRIAACFIASLGLGWLAYGKFVPSENQGGSVEPVAIQGDNSTQAVPGSVDSPALLSIQPPSASSALQAAVQRGPGHDLLLQAKRQLEHIKPFRARMTQTIRIGSTPIQATGDYIEGESDRLRMDLTISTPHTQGRLLNVSDGSILWTEFLRHSPELAPEGEPKITRRDLGSILQLSESTGNVDNGRYISDLAVGGLNALYASLAREMVFREPVEFSQGGIELWKLKGTWSQAFLDRHEVTDLRKLPRHIPDGVEIYFDRRTLFPHRILFTQEQAEEPVKKLITFDFTEVQFKPELTEHMFDYELTAQSYDDVTNQFERKLLEQD